MDGEIFFLVNATLFGLGVAAECFLSSHKLNIILKASISFFKAMTFHVGRNNWFPAILPKNKQMQSGEKQAVSQTKAKHNDAVRNKEYFILR